jgi:hypothetical protein
MEEIVNRALTVIQSNPDWIDYVKNFNDSNGFMFCESKLLKAIGDAIDDENPCHSGTSIAMCLKECKMLLNQT